jgi:hypothetical protein
VTALKTSIAAFVESPVALASACDTLVHFKWFLALDVPECAEFVGGAG